MAYSKLVQSGNFIEFYQYENDLTTHTRHSSKREKARNRKGIKNNQRREDNIRRQRNNFLRLVRANFVGDQNPCLFTFTMLAVCTIGEAWSEFSEFISRFRKGCGIDFRYIAVPEFQKRGAVHFHCLFWGIDEEIIKQEKNDRRVQNCWGYGYVDCVQTDGGPGLALYLAKYMQKSLQDFRLCGKKAFSASRNCLRSVSVSHKAVVDAVDIIVDKSDIVYQKDYEVQWLGKCRYTLYNIKRS